MNAPVHVIVGQAAPVQAEACGTVSSRGEGQGQGRARGAGHAAALQEAVEGAVSTREQGRNGALPALASWLRRSAMMPPCSRVDRDQFGGAA